MIGRFVEQNDRGVMDRNPRQTEFRLFAAAQRIDRIGQADMRQSPMVEGGAAAGFDVPIVGQNVVTAGIGAAAAGWRGAHPSLSATPKTQAAEMPAATSCWGT